MKKIILLSAFAFLYMFSVAQSVTPSAPKIQKVGYFHCYDPEGGLKYEISAGNTGKYFSIDRYSGLITVKREAFSSFKEQRTWHLTIKIMDSPTFNDKRVNTIRRICTVVAKKTITPGGKVVLQTSLEFDT